MNFCIRLLLLILFLATTKLHAQNEHSTPPITGSFMLGYGHASVLESYLSPYKYSGTDYRLITEFSALRNSGKRLSGHIFDLNYSRLTNQSGRGLYHLALIDYSYYRDYRVFENEKWKWMVGGASNLMGGAIYNVRNSNNPAQMKAVLNLGFSSRAEYAFHIKTIPINLVYEFRTPLLGVGFAPEFGESYYEMFQLNNTKGLIHFFSLYNQWAMQNELTCEIPFGTTTLCFGYYYNLYQTSINDLETSISASNFTFGFSKEILFARKKRGGAK